MKTVYVVQYCGLDGDRPVAAFPVESWAEDYIDRQKEGRHSEIHHYEIREVSYHEEYP